MGETKMVGGYMTLSLVCLVCSQAIEKIRIRVNHEPKHLEIFRLDRSQRWANERRAACETAETREHAESNFDQIPAI
jgi:hypothetical protein